MGVVEVDGMRIAFERAGAGPALVLLHGYVGDGRATWHKQIDSLSDRFTVVAWDAPGAGGSSDPPEAYGMAGYADILAAFVARLGLDNPHVAGLSFGSALALELYRRHPAVPKTLVLASAYAGWGGSLSAAETERRLRQALALSLLSPDEFVAELLPSMFSAETGRVTVEHFGAIMRGFHPVGFRAMARAAAEDLRDVLPQVRLPTLLVYGDKDARAPLHVARHLQSAMTGSDLVVMPGVGHFCNIEAADEFNTAVRDFLLAAATDRPDGAGSARRS